LAVLDFFGVFVGGEEGTCFIVDEVADDLSLVVGEVASNAATATAAAAFTFKPLTCLERNRYAQLV